MHTLYTHARALARTHTNDFVLSPKEEENYIYSSLCVIDYTAWLNHRQISRLLIFLSLT